MPRSKPWPPSWPVAIERTARRRCVVDASGGWARRVPAHMDAPAIMVFMVGVGSAGIHEAAVAVRCHVRFGCGRRPRQTAARHGGEKGISPTGQPTTTAFIEKQPGRRTHRASLLLVRSGQHAGVTRLGVEEPCSRRPTQTCVRCRTGISSATSRALLSAETAHLVGDPFRLLSGSGAHERFGDRGVAWVHVMTTPAAGCGALRRRVPVALPQSRCRAPRGEGLDRRMPDAARRFRATAVTRPSVVLAGQVVGPLLGESAVEQSGGLADFDHVAVGVPHVTANLSTTIDRRRHELGPL